MCVCNYLHEITMRVYIQSVGLDNSRASLRSLGVGRGVHGDVYLEGEERSTGILC